MKSQAFTSRLGYVLLGGVALVAIPSRAGYGFERWPRSEMAIARGLFGPGAASSGLWGGRAGLDPPGVGFHVGSAALERLLLQVGFRGMGRMGVDPPGFGFRFAPGEPAWVRGELGSPFGRLSGLTTGTPLNNYLLWRLSLDPVRFTLNHPRTGPLLVQQLASPMALPIASPNSSPAAQFVQPPSGSGSPTTPPTVPPSSETGGTPPPVTPPPVTPPNPQGVPEPSSAVLLVVGLSSLAGVRRLWGKHRRAGVPSS